MKQAYAAVQGTITAVATTLIGATSAANTVVKAANKGAQQLDFYIDQLTLDNENDITKGIGDRDIQYKKIVHDYNEAVKPYEDQVIPDLLKH